MNMRDRNVVYNNNSVSSVMGRVFSKSVLLALAAVVFVGLIALAFINNSQATLAHDQASHEGGVNLTYSRLGTTLLVQAEITSPSGHRVYTSDSDSSVTWRYVLLDDKDDCDYTAEQDGLKPDRNFEGTAVSVSAATASERFTSPISLGDVLAVGNRYVNDDNPGLHGKSVCIEALYYTKDADGNVDTVSYQYLVSDEVIDAKPPRIIEDGIRLIAPEGSGDDGEYTAADIGANIDIVVTFDEELEVFFAEPRENPVSRGHHSFWPVIHFSIPTSDVNWDGALGQGTPGFYLQGTYGETIADSGDTLTFRMTINYDIRDYLNEEGVFSIDSDDLNFIDFSDYAIRDMNGVHAPILAATQKPNSIFSIASSHYLDKDFEITIDTSPIANIHRDGQKLEATISPTGGEYTRSYALDDEDPLPIVTTGANGGSYTFYSSEDEDDCEDIATSGNQVAMGTALSYTLPDQADDKYYCMVVVERAPIGAARNQAAQDVVSEAVARKAYSNVYHYVADTSVPVIGQPQEMGDQIVIEVSDSGSGVESLSWGRIRSDSPACTDPTLFNFNKRETGNTINIATGLIPAEGLEICVRAEDGDGNLVIAVVSINHTSSETEEPVVVDPEMPDATDPDQDMTDSNNEQDDDEQGHDQDDQDMESAEEVFTGLPDNWDSLTAHQKTALNPYGCLDTTQIRADTGQCISGGSRFSDEELVNPVPVNPGVAADDDGSDFEEDELQQESTGVAEINFDVEDGILNLSGNGTDGTNLSNWMYAITDEGSDCAEADDYKQVSDDGIDVSELADDMVVCVRASDEGAENAYIYKQYTASSAADSTSETSDDGETASDETEEESDEEGGAALLWILIGIAAIILVAVAVGTSSKKKDTE